MQTIGTQRVRTALYCREEFASSCTVPVGCKFGLGGERVQQHLRPEHPIGIPSGSLSGELVRSRWRSGKGALSTSRCCHSRQEVHRKNSDKRICGNRGLQGPGPIASLISPVTRLLERSDSGC